VSLAGCNAARALRGRLSGRCTDAAAPSAEGIAIVRGVIPTHRARGPVRFAVAIPVGGPRVDAVAYVLPGRGSTADAVFEPLGFDGFLTAAIRAGVRPFALASMDAGESYFHPRRSGEDRLGVATIDLPRVVEKVLGVRVMREALIGMSMGGYGALLAAEMQPSRYRSVAVAGPAVFASYEDENRSVGDAFDDRADFVRHDIVAHAAVLRKRSVFIRIGDADPFVAGVRAFSRSCSTADVAVVRGCHDDGFWRAMASQMLSFIGSRF
jgi:pimeloyl-ACP methyl ester carboxylesterase